MILGNFKHELELQKLEDQWQESVKQLEERKAFLEKQAKDLNDAIEKHHKAYWNKVEAYFQKEKRFPPWYDSEKFSISCDRESGVFTLENKEDALRDMAFKNFIRQLRGDRIVEVEVEMKGEPKDE